VNIRVIISRTKDKKNIKLGSGSTVEDVLSKINIKHDTVIVTYKNRPIPIDYDLKDGYELTIIQVASGG
jgi:sulfur carrier protein ThiS